MAHKEIPTIPSVQLLSRDLGEFKKQPMIEWSEEGGGQESGRKILAPDLTTSGTGTQKAVSMILTFGQLTTIIPLNFQLGKRMSETLSLISTWRMVATSVHSLKWVSSSSKVLEKRNYLPVQHWSGIQKPDEPGTLVIL